ncbi:hypothetical protein SK128_014479 [Halocaridina rubra]|uniref:Uncharacterized protein n=1 Tax=Halocaridina rubra TaxID=373956 RepID=A0AAN8WRB7_HALRR
MFPHATQERRRASWNLLSTSDSYRPRSASASFLSNSANRSVINSSHRAPATPCFVSPRMAFSTQFDYDSPIQVLTSSSPCVFKPMSLKRWSSPCSLKRLTPHCKALLILLLLSLAASLYFIRNSRESRDHSVPCSDYSCDDVIHGHPRFFGSVTPPPSYHTLSDDLDNPSVELPNAPSLLNDPNDIDPQDGIQSYYLESPVPIISTDVQPPISQMSATNSQRALKISGIYVEEKPASGSKEVFLDKSNEQSDPEKKVDIDSPDALENDESSHAQARERRNVHSEGPNLQSDSSSDSGLENFDISVSQNQKFEGEINAFSQINTPSASDDLFSQRTEGMLMYHQYAASGENYIISNSPGFANFQPPYAQTYSNGHTPHIADIEREAHMARQPLRADYRPEGYPYEEMHGLAYHEQMHTGVSSGGAPLSRPHFASPEQMAFYGRSQKNRIPPGVNPRRYRNEF